MTFDVFVMQAFSGISLFTILVLMALGLAIIFGLMGVINMAHGEIMALGAYVTYLTASIFEKYMPSLMGIYIFFAITFAFLATFAFGWLLERSFIRFLYNRPLDTLLATWGLSLRAAADLPLGLRRPRSKCLNDQVVGWRLGAGIPAFSCL